jgi:inorganic pyrophosphatase
MAAAIEKLRPGLNPPSEINVVVEIPKDSNVKYEIDRRTGEIYVDRILFPSMIYPCNYGFLPQTRVENDSIDGEGDPLDVFILGNYSLIPSSVIACRPIGILLTEDQDGVDPKIIAVPLSRIDRSFSAIEDITDIPEQLLIQLKHFVEHHKDLEKGKYTNVGSLKGRRAAENTVSEAIKLYNKII